MKLRIQSLPSSAWQAVSSPPNLTIDGTIFEKCLGLASSPKPVAGRSLQGGIVAAHRVSDYVRQLRHSSNMSAGPGCPRSPQACRPAQSCRFGDLSQQPSHRSHSLVAGECQVPHQPGRPVRSRRNPCSDGCVETSCGRQSLTRPAGEAGHQRRKFALELVS